MDLEGFWNLISGIKGGSGVNIGAGIFLLVFAGIVGFATFGLLKNLRDA